MIQHTLVQHTMVPSCLVIIQHTLVQHSMVPRLDFPVSFLSSSLTKCKFSGNHNDNSHRKDRRERENPAKTNTAVNLCDFHWPKTSTAEETLLSFHDGSVQAGHPAKNFRLIETGTIPLMYPIHSATMLKLL